MATIVKWRWLTREVKNCMVIPLMHKAALVQVMKFLVVGTCGTLINYSFFYLLYTWFTVYYLLASIIGYVMGVLFGYILNRNWSFAQHQGNQPSRLKEFSSYVSVYLLSLLISSLALVAGVRGLHLDPRLANVLTIFISTVCNFIGLKFFVFTHATTHKN